VKKLLIFPLKNLFPEKNSPRGVSIRIYSIFPSRKRLKLKSTFYLIKTITISDIKNIFSFFIHLIFPLSSYILPQNSKINEIITIYYIFICFFIIFYIKELVQDFSYTDRKQR